MPPEVIDLLSSPEVEPRSTSAFSNKPSHVPPPSAQRNVLDDDLDFDTFDLTADDVPPPLTAKSLARKRPSLGMGDPSEDDQTLRPIENSARNPTVKETSTLDIDMSGMSSDGFLDIDNVTRSTTGGGRITEPARKRLRLSPPIPHSNSPKPRLAQTHVSATTKSPSRLVTSRNSSSRVLDVEFSSSPHSSSPKISKTSAPPPKPTYRDEDDDSDLFKSPPPRPTREQKGKGLAMTTTTLDVTIIEDSDDDGPVSATPQRTNNRILWNDEDPFAYSPPRANPQPRERSRTLTAAADWDPISSSAPLPSKPSPRRSMARSHSEVIALNDSDNDAFADPLSDDDDDFPDISVPRIESSYAAIEVTGPSKRRFTKSASTTTGAPRPKATGTKKTAEERAKEKEVKALEKKAAAERKKQERERERQQKAEEKQRAAARAEANKLKTKKEVATPEMIVDLPSSLPQALKIQTEEYLKKVDVHRITTWTSPIDNVVRWRRVLNARYNEERHHYDPIPETIETEKFSLVFLPAAEFAKLAMGPEGEDLEAHVLKMQRHFPSHQILYLIEGMADLLSKSRNKRNREFASAVRSGLAADDNNNNSVPTSTARRARKNDPPVAIDESQINIALLQLQLHHHMLIYDTARPADTALVIQLFTQQLATAPYKQRQDEYFMKSAGFCMESGQVRTGIGPEEIYVRMLQEIARITAPIAMGIVNEYPRVAKLVLALERGGPATLENVRRAINKEGEVGDKRVGKAVSKRLWKIFTGRDEMSTEV